MSVPLLIIFCKELRVLHGAFCQKSGSLTKLSYCSCSEPVSAVCRSCRQIMDFALSPWLSGSSIPQTSLKYSENATATFTEQILIQRGEKFPLFFFFCGGGGWG